MDCLMVEWWQSQAQSGKAMVRLLIFRVLRIFVRRKSNPLSPSFCVKKPTGC